MYVPNGAVAPCPRNCTPVCGCDGVTFGNKCTADEMRVDILNKGREYRDEENKAIIQ